MDTDGRVIRVDSFSKILAPGIRLAWVTTTPNNLVHCLNASFMPTLGPSTMSQGLAYALLNTWRLEGFEKYIKNIQMCYRPAGECILRVMSLGVASATWGVCVIPRCMCVCFCAGVVN